MYLNLVLDLYRYSSQQRQPNATKQATTLAFSMSATLSQAAIAHHIYLYAQELFKLLYQGCMPLVFSWASTFQS